MSGPDYAASYYMGVADLEDAARGMLRGEDWENEMREALGVLKEVRQQKRKADLAKVLRTYDKGGH